MTPLSTLILPFQGWDPPSVRSVLYVSFIPSSVGVPHTTLYGRYYFGESRPRPPTSNPPSSRSPFDVPVDSGPLSTEVYLIPSPSPSSPPPGPYTLCHPPRVGHPESFPKPNVDSLSSLPKPLSHYCTSLGTKIFLEDYHSSLPQTPVPVFVSLLRES